MRGPINILGAKSGFTPKNSSITSYGECGASSTDTPLVFKYVFRCKII